MNVNISDGMLSFSVSDLLDEMSSEQKKELIDHLACDTEVITLIGQQITEGFTEMMSRGYMSCYAQSEPKFGLDKVLRDIAKASSGVVKEEIGRLEDSLSACQERESNLLKELLYERSGGQGYF